MASKLVQHKNKSLLGAIHKFHLQALSVSFDTNWDDCRCFSRCSYSMNDNLFISPSICSFLFIKTRSLGHSPPLLLALDKGLRALWAPMALPPVLGAFGPPSIVEGAKPNMLNLVSKQVTINYFGVWFYIYIYFILLYFFIYLFFLLFMYLFSYHRVIIGLSIRCYNRSPLLLLWNSCIILLCL